MLFYGGLKEVSIRSRCSWRSPDRALSHGMWPRSAWPLHNGQDTSHPAREGEEARVKNGSITRIHNHCQLMPLVVAYPRAHTNAF